jgi:hypothetical protein
MDSAPAREAQYSRSKLQMAMQCQDVEFIGHTVNLMFVDDENLAMILSAAARQYMDCLVVKDSATAVTLYNRNVKCWAIDQMQTFQVSDGTPPRLRGRNDSEKSTGELPLPAMIRSNHGAGLAGNPRYLVNLVQLPPQQEHLRDTLVFGVFGTSLLLDDLASALALRKSLLSKNRKPPPMWTLEGDRVPANGVMSPTVITIVYVVDNCMLILYVFNRIRSRVALNSTTCSAK